MRGSVAAPRRTRLDPARIMPATIAGPAARRNRVEPRRDLHRFRVRPRPGEARPPRGSAIVPLLVTFGAGDVQGRRRPVDRRSSGSGWSPRTRRSRRPRPRRRATSRTPTRPRSRPAPRRSSRSTSRARCRARSRAPRSPATCCPTARSTSSTRSAPRWPRGSSPRWASSSRPRADRPPRSPRSLEARAPDMRMYVALETLEYLKKGGRISGAQAAIGTLLSVKPIIAVKDGVVETVGPGPDAVEGARAARSSSSASGRSSGWRSSTRSAPTSRRSATRSWPGRRVSIRRDVSIEPRRGVGRAAPRARAASARRSCTDRARRPRRPAAGDRTLRQGCDNVADRYHRAGAIGRVAAILGARMSRASAVQPVRSDPTARPVGSSGRRPEPTAVDVTARHVRNSVP